VKVVDFVTVDDASLDAFLSVSAASPHQEQLREYAESLLQRRSTRPGWCVLGLESGVPVARAALWALPDETVPTPTSAVVAYVGVVPEQRGRGLAAQLVRRATEQLIGSGAGEIQGDCDRDNVPMVKAFRRAGYEQIARRRSYERAPAA
jgi:ribosomal protein S18 acetylase RimI-like enzyme